MESHPKLIEWSGPNGIEILFCTDIVGSDAVYEPEDLTYAVRRRPDGSLRLVDDTEGLPDDPVDYAE